MSSPSSPYLPKASISLTILSLVRSVITSASVAFITHFRDSHSLPAFPYASAAILYTSSILPYNLSCSYRLTSSSAFDISSSSIFLVSEEKEDVLGLRMSSNCGLICWMSFMRRSLSSRKADGRLQCEHVH